jgi:hypothetical protein
MFRVTLVARLPLERRRHVAVGLVTLVGGRTGPFDELLE